MPVASVLTLLSNAESADSNINSNICQLGVWKRTGVTWPKLKRAIATGFGGWYYDICYKANASKPLPRAHEVKTFLGVTNEILPEQAQHESN